MRIKNLYECNENCRNCTYEFKKPTGYTIMDECSTDKCPYNNYKIGNIDKIGGRHVEGHGWNPLGEYCKECNHNSCEDCVKWSNRDKKLRNNVPPALKTPPPVTKPSTNIPIQQPLTVAETLATTNDAVLPQNDTNTKQDSAAEIVAKVRETIGNNGIPLSQLDKPIIRPKSVFDFDFDEKDRRSLLDELDTDDIDDLFGSNSVDTIDINPVLDKSTSTEILTKSQIQPSVINDDFITIDRDVSIQEVDILPDSELSSTIATLPMKENEETIEKITENDNDNDEEEISFSENDNIDFGIDNKYNETDNDFTNYDNVSFDGDDDYEIPMPDEYIEDLEILTNAQKEMYEIEDDDDDDDLDEDEDTEFELYEQTKKLKHSILFAPETKIARYQVRDKGVYLSVSGEAKVTVKGRNDSDGFSYCDANRFPRYVREGILSGELYDNPNIKITDDTTFNFIYFEVENGEIVQKEEKLYTSSIDNASEDKIRRILKKILDEFIN